MKYLLALFLFTFSLSINAQNEPFPKTADSDLTQSEAYKRIVALKKAANDLYLSGRYEEALDKYKSAYQLLILEQQGDPKLLAFLTFNIGLSNLRLGNRGGLDKMEAGFNIALKIPKGFEAITAEFANYLAVEFLLDYAGAKPDSALKYYHIATVSNSRNFNSQDFKLTPDINTAFSGYEMYRSLIGKAYSYELKFIQTSGTEWVDAAYQMILVADSLVNAIRQIPIGYDDEIELSDELTETLHYGIRISQQLYEITGDKKYAETAFLFFEKTKSNQALFNSNIPSESLGIPSEYLEREKVISKALFAAETLWYNEPEEHKIAGHEKKVKKLKEELREHREYIKLEYPEYYAYKYDIDYLTIDQTKALLKKDEVLLSYNLFNSNVYSFRIDKDGFDLQFHRVDSSLRAHISRFSNTLHSPNISKEAVSEFKLFSKEITSLLFSDQLDLDKYSKITILPDGILNVLPFDALLREESNTGKSFKELPYLVKTHDIKYATSATALARQMKRKVGKNNRVLAIAPLFDSKTVLNLNQFDSTRAAMGNLAYTKAEVNKIGSHFPTTIMLDSMATEKAFRQNAADYSILHIASHAVLDEKNSLYSKLLFSPFDTDSVSDGYLNALEILGMDIHADMVVLSACNTGVGKILGGEGVVGLANSFFYAGAKSLIMTLWTANDASTSLLMEEFYRHLSLGRSKGMSLQNAKLTYLESADELLSHPYYWAHFIVKGDDSPLTIKSDFPYIWILISLLAIIIISFLFKKKRAVTLPA